jgi:hypothetical protein
MLSLAHRFLFIHIPKTAGNAIQRALLPFSEDQMVLTATHQDGVERFEIRSPQLEIHKHSALAEYRAQLPREQFDGLFKFTCVRNPWERCVSFFFSPHRGPVEWSPEAFEDLVDRQVQPANHYLQITGDETDPFANVDAVIRFERLEADFAAVCQRIELGPLPLPRINASARSDYRRYYRDDGIIERVARRFAPEIERFGYKFDP